MQKCRFFHWTPQSFPTGPEGLDPLCGFYRGLNASTVYEAHGIETINSSQILDVCGNKLKTSQILAKKGVPTPRTIVAFSPEAAMQAVEEIGYPCVMKPIVGSGEAGGPDPGSRNRGSFHRNARNANDSMQTIFYIQEMIKRPPRDIRCIAVGEDIVACVYRYSSAENWKTNVALGGHTEPCKVTPELEETVMKTVDVIGKGVLGIDLMERSSSEFVVHEVNGTVEFKGAKR